MYGHYSELQQFAREFAASRSRSQQTRQGQQPTDVEEARRRKSKAWSEFSPIPKLPFLVALISGLIPMFIPKSPISLDSLAPPRALAKINGKNKVSFREYTWGEPGNEAKVLSLRHNLPHPQAFPAAVNHLQDEKCTCG